MIRTNDCLMMSRRYRRSSTEIACFPVVSWLRNRCPFSWDFSHKSPDPQGVRPGQDWPPYCVMEATKESVYMRDNATIRTLRNVAGLLPVALLAPIAGCSNGSDGGALPADVKAIVFLQRT